jgi:hypothetical protein
MEQEQQRQHCLEGFLRHTESQDTEEALRYLEASCWNVNKAIQAFDRDAEKEENRRKFLESHPNWLPTPGTQGKRSSPPYRSLLPVCFLLPNSYLCTYFKWIKQIQLVSLLG